MKLYNKIDKRDVIAVDGGYSLFIKQFEDLCKNKNILLNDDNFFYPIRKEPDIDMNVQEKHFNDVFGSFRSIIENQFSELHNKYKRFIFTESFNIITQEHHKLWMSRDFDFPTKYKLVDIVLNNEINQMDKIKRMTEIQNDFSDLNMNGDDMVVDDVEQEEITNSDEAVDFPQYNNINKKKRKKGKSERKVNINLIREITKDNQFYEIENIIKHKISESNDYIFLVKWKGYGSKDNSWVNEKDFSSKDSIKDYFIKQNIKY
ncbi:uncharacterized protein B0P05DRAFT_475155 [Gilbertella persicaria]|uniref:uncharacterized protein n=1 Tax=Gilbertella persicaria TaxID=101096 RepID=UPI00221E7699|nr:uncharacterized protein B0P05DRAFT_475155 [Gilbertella persicaria]KAI8068100.1 hypothetical protein B0P05DRAFT_475155 [Gilbertella persicaria]